MCSFSMNNENIKFVLTEIRHTQSLLKTIQYCLGGQKGLKNIT